VSRLRRAPTARPEVIKPLAPERFKVQFTIDRSTYDKLRQAQDLLRHTIPNGDPALIFDRALTLLLAELSKTNFAATPCPRAGRPARRGSRHIPAASGETSGAAMEDSARFAENTVAAARRDFSNFIT